MAVEGELQRVFGENLRRYRLTRSLSQEGLADVLGFNRAYIGILERGERNLTFRTAERYAELIGVPILELLTPRNPDPERRRAS